MQAAARRNVASKFDFNRSAVLAAKQGMALSRALWLSLFSSILASSITALAFLLYLKSSETGLGVMTPIVVETRSQERARDERASEVSSASQFDAIEKRIMVLEANISELSEQSFSLSHAHNHGESAELLILRAREVLSEKLAKPEFQRNDDWFFSIDEGESEYPISTSALPPSVTDSDCRGSYCRVEISEQLLEVAKSEYWNDMSPLERKLEMITELTSGLEGVKLTEGKNQGGSSIFYISRPNNKTSP